jgi:hypothetical protein
MSNSIYDMIDQINTSFDGLWFHKIEGYSLVGEIRSDAHLHPIQYYAYTNVRRGDDDPFEGVGWTPSEAIRNLLKVLKDTNA